jgi:hypothetical protein
MTLYVSRLSSAHGVRYSEDVLCLVMAIFGLEPCYDVVSTWILGFDYAQGNLRYGLRFTWQDEARSGDRTNGLTGARS